VAAACGWLLAAPASAQLAVPAIDQTGQQLFVPNGYTQVVSPSGHGLHSKNNNIYVAPPVYQSPTGMSTVPPLPPGGSAIPGSGIATAPPNAIVIGGSPQPAVPQGAVIVPGGTTIPQTAPGTTVIMPQTTLPQTTVPVMPPTTAAPQSTPNLIPPPAPPPSGKKEGFLHNLFHHRGRATPAPAFAAPPPPPKCAPSSDSSSERGCGLCWGCRSKKGCMSRAGGAYGDDCTNGPPAVLFDDFKGHWEQTCNLPEKGERGRILLTPQRIIAPIGGEVVLLAGLCGTDGYLSMGQPLEWMLTGDSVGHIIGVGDDGHSVLAKGPAPEKLSGVYARGRTSTRPATITRGSRTSRDDVRVGKGQTWITISSPNEGLTRITALAPESDCWDQRHQTATIYWVDARWEFPQPQRVRSGSPVRLSTRVTRSEGFVPALDWIVRYTILNPERAVFAQNGTNTIDARVGPDGFATVDVQPRDGSNGMAMVDVQIIRPMDPDGPLPQVALARGTTSITWSAPQLVLRVGGPEVVAQDQPFSIIANLANAGDEPAENVVVQMKLPPGTTFQGSRIEHRLSGDVVQWQLDRLPAQTQLDLDLTVTARENSRFFFDARARDVTVSSEVTVQVLRPSLRAQMTVAGPTELEVGQDARFNIDVVNIGSRPLTNVRLVVEGDAGMIHRQSGRQRVEQQQTQLGPGETFGQGSPPAVTFVPQQPGQRTVRLTVTADGQQPISTEASVLVRNPAPALPVLSVDIVEEGLTVDGRPQLQFVVRNPGSSSQRNVRLSVAWDAILRSTQASMGYDPSSVAPGQLSWLIDELPGGASQSRAMQFEVLQTGRARILATVVSDQVAAVRSERTLDVIAPVSRPLGGTTSPAPGTLAPVPGTAPPAAGSTVPPTSSTVPPAGGSSPLSAGSGNLEIQLFDETDPTYVGQPIRYRLSVRNGRNVPDTAVDIRLQFPEGVQFSSVTQTMFGTSTTVDLSVRGTVRLGRIAELRPGERIEYTVEFISILPIAQLQIAATAVSQLTPQGVSDTQTTEVRARN
jgi:hypothetical protein